jgi:hypothetical protein
MLLAYNCNINEAKLNWAEDSELISTSTLKPLEVVAALMH